MTNSIYDNLLSFPLTSEHHAQESPTTGEIPHCTFNSEKKKYSSAFLHRDNLCLK